ncbi:MAG: hypothetical protein KDA66_01075 [Planctomycetaceae bacterium]|nr:hypothetical protein [Planctomycetaceae bacterium]
MSRLTSSIVTLAVLVTAATVNGQDFSNVKSGLLVGVYASPGSGGMRVSDTIPGYSAEGRLFPGDVLLRTTVDGFDVYRLRSHYEMENAKIAIGPNREAAMEIWRPGVGLIYAWVEFTPIASPTGTYGAQVPCKAQFRMESEKPGARRMFDRGNTGGGRPPVIDRAPRPMPRERNDNGNPGNLFGGR